MIGGAFGDLSEHTRFGGRFRLHRVEDRRRDEICTTCFSLAPSILCSRGYRSMTFSPPSGWLVLFVIVGASRSRKSKLRPWTSVMSRWS